MPTRRLIAPALALSLAAFAAPALAQDGPDRPQINVSGNGEAFGTADMAVVTLGVSEQAKSAQEALRANSEAMTKVTQALKDQGIADRDLQTSGFSIQPVYEQPRPGQASERKIVGYRVDNLLTVRIRDLESAGSTLDKVVELGSNRIQNLSFTIDDPKPLEEEARKKAVEDARARAEQLAEAAGITLGPIQSISEQSYGRPQPKMMAMARAQMDEAAVPLEGGEVSVEVQVNMVWGIEE
ncbi:SIMPL domain-containing protein [Afifella sp. H1R]|uniref:SIMPL domain-containing protein n=1 Tax=Afifella sp. H1R TaxID=2908841 RepID=UPI001F316C8C|nr:SIMPL domain-containing protein [Afifella sp. H1R]MCF1502577.1 SIMPL domain-containing protein [Afifella sp. H1R]